MQTHVNGHLDETEVTANTNTNTSSVEAVIANVNLPPAPERTSDIDNKQTCSSSVIPKISNALAFSSANIHHILIDTDIDHYGSGADYGWGGGYRNIQMLLSALIQVFFCPTF